MKHAVDTVQQRRREQKDRRDLHELQQGGDRAQSHDITHVDFSHLSAEEIELTRKNIQEKYRKKNRNFAYVLAVIVVLILAAIAYVFFYLAKSDW